MSTGPTGASVLLASINLALAVLAVQSVPPECEPSCVTHHAPLSNIHPDNIHSDI